MLCYIMNMYAIGKFLPFKTPLDARYNSQISEEYRFDLQLLFSSLRSSPVSDIHVFTNNSKHSAIDICWNLIITLYLEATKKTRVLLHVG